MNPDLGCQEEERKKADILLLLPTAARPNSVTYFSDENLIMRWECRHSSSEMLYIEVASLEVKCYLDHSEDRAEWWSFEEVLSGDRDRFVANLFGEAALEEIKREVRMRRREGT